MSKRNPNLIDRIASFLPGYTDYIEKKESYHENGKIKIELTLNLQKKIFNLQKQSTPNVECLKKKSQCIEELMNLIDRINASSYGYSSLFSKKQISKNEFESIQRYDMDIAEMILEIINTDSFDDIAKMCTRVETTISNRQVKISQYV